MAFVLKDETAGIDIMYVDNANQMGLGSLPVNGQALTVNSYGLISPEAPSLVLLVYREYR